MHTTAALGVERDGLLPVDRLGVAEERVDVAGLVHARRLLHDLDALNAPAEGDRRWARAVVEVQLRVGADAIEHDEPRSTPHRRRDHEVGAERVEIVGNLPDERGAPGRRDVPLAIARA
jgi:hypothetical protein